MSRLSERRIQLLIALVAIVAALCIPLLLDDLTRPTLATSTA